MGSRSPQRLPGFLTRRLFLRRSGGGVMAAGVLAEGGRAGQAEARPKATQEGRPAAADGRVAGDGRRSG